MFAAELATPLTNILNAQESGNHLVTWKFECTTPCAQRTILCTSNFAKLFERFLKKWILEDISAKQTLHSLQTQRELGLIISWLPWWIGS